MIAYDKVFMLINHQNWQWFSFNIANCIKKHAIHIVCVNWKWHPHNTNCGWV